MDWNLKINGEKVRLQISDRVAVVPPKNFLRTGAEIEDLISNYPDANDDSTPERRMRRDIATFERAGWQFIEPTAAYLSLESTEGRPDRETRQVFISKSGDVLIETDIATVQLNASAKTTRQMAEKILAADGLRIVEQLSFAPHVYAVRLPRGRPLPETILALQAKPHRYVFAEPSLLERIGGRQDPTDPQFALQWQHSDEVGLHSVAAWETAKGRGVCIAVIDNGMQIDHDELKTGIVGGGYFKKTVPGSGTATFFRYQAGMSGFPIYGHGTACMGMAGGRDNNGNGGCGIAPKSDLLAIACALDQTGTQLTLARSFEFAVDPKAVDPQGTLTRGADVISCSLSASNHVYTVLQMAIDSAAAGRNGLGVPIFWAVSNFDTQISADKVCSLPNVIAVGRTASDGNPHTCGHGPKLEFLAPGLDVWGPTRNNNNIPWSGTSFAAPLAAGVAALVIEKYPTWTAQQVLQRLRDTCEIPEEGDADHFGHGRLNAHSAVL